MFYTCPDWDLTDWWDIVVTYVRHFIGGAAKFKEFAEKKQKTVINLFGIFFLYIVANFIKLKYNIQRWIKMSCFVICHRQIIHVNFFQHL